MKNVTDFRKTVESGVDPHLSLYILNQKSKVNPKPCKFAMFCSVNNFSNLFGYQYFSAFDHVSCSKTEMELSLS